MCHLKDPSKQNEIECTVKNNKKFLLKWTRD